jgi:hypothetical protein
MFPDIIHRAILKTLKHFRIFFKISNYYILDYFSNHFNHFYTRKYGVNKPENINASN